jgi:hypothetical protein
MHRRRPNAAALLHFVEAHSTITDFRALWKHRKEQRAQLSRLGLRSALEVSTTAVHLGAKLKMKAEREREPKSAKWIKMNYHTVLTCHLVLYTPHPLPCDTAFLYIYTALASVPHHSHSPHHPHTAH